VQKRDESTFVVRLKPPNPTAIFLRHQILTKFAERKKKKILFNNTVKRENAPRSADFGVFPVRACLASIPGWRRCGLGALARRAGRCSGGDPAPDVIIFMMMILLDIYCRELVASPLILPYTSRMGLAAVRSSTFVCRRVLGTCHDVEPFFRTLLWICAFVFFVFH
jgi:hypothetical protein